MEVENTRIHRLNDAPLNGEGHYVLYWMQQSQRALGNPALSWAVKRAKSLDMGVVVLFCLMEDYPEANARHFTFMLEGLQETASVLKEHGIQWVLKRSSPDRALGDLLQDASLLVGDFGYLRHQRQWRELAAGQSVRAVAIEGDVVVPVESTSNKREYAARTIRSKINNHKGHYIKRLGDDWPEVSTLELDLRSDLDLGRPVPDLVESLDIDHGVQAVDQWKGGTSEARRHLESFLRSRLDGYADERNDPLLDGASKLSPYLHFGQISAVEVADKVRSARSGRQKDRDSLLEELLVRRELAVNYVHFEPDYDQYKALPEWARQTLEAHRDDPREHRYTRAELEQAKTHDDYWNAAMRQMKQHGYLHNHMRMYWGKQIIAWCNTPEYAYRTALYLNNKYFLDGRDCNSWANVGWLFGLHDRAWQENPVFGKVRTMTASGLERKFDVKTWVKQV